MSKVKPRRLTRQEKEWVLGNGKNPKDYLYAYDINSSFFKIKHKVSGVETTCDKFRRAKHRFDY